MKKRLQGEEKFPLVLMLEPTHQCNLSCHGCGRIQEYRDTLGQSLTLEECLGAVSDCGAPVVTVTGGEPLLYPPVFELLPNCSTAASTSISAPTPYCWKNPCPGCPVPTG